MKTPFNPSTRAAKRVKNPLPKPESCNCCGGSVEIVRNSEIYNGRSFGQWPWVYLCRSCGAYVGMHPLTDIPLGTLANRETRIARKRSKAPFELLHKTGKMTRSEAYRRLAEKLGIEKGQCHFGWFDVAMCERAEVAVREILLD
ncbi:hypothetical protein GZ77_08945 [Endozoicomonas montiporae]|uniref:Uncharacterized protein n=2 Tax=Endozoicomonas montiporae TaxID=1027273 RepID=A0A081N7Q4_9GAMM|nr:zinc-finger-containing protein [Endozoicomonas montiporae]AMO55667.1 hypothetical protein EZMO1_1499 [Endozoicomonas montiporae CL-33]KEQ14477.1 hypothetical protein GZ77_08945 [Endozoicomonas montiporae]